MYFTHIACNGIETNNYKFLEENIASRTAEAYKLYTLILASGNFNKLHMIVLKHIIINYEKSFFFIQVMFIQIKVFVFYYFTYFILLLLIFMLKRIVWFLSELIMEYGSAFDRECVENLVTVFTFR